MLPGKFIFSILMILKKNARRKCGNSSLTYASLEDIPTLDELRERVKDSGLL